MQDIYMVFQ